MHGERITREEFLEEMGRRFDEADSQNRGYVTPEELRGILSDDASAANTDSSTSSPAPLR